MLPLNVEVYNYSLQASGLQHFIGMCTAEKFCFIFQICLCQISRIHNVFGAVC